MIDFERGMLDGFIFALRGLLLIEKETVKIKVKKRLELCHREMNVIIGDSSGESQTLQTRKTLCRSEGLCFSAGQS